MKVSVNKKYAFSAAEYTGSRLSDRRVVIVADIEDDIPNVGAMAGYFASHYSNAEIVNLRSIKTGPCLGCLKCGFDNICAYDGKDEFNEVLKNKILSSDTIVFALGMHDRYFSHVWQRYLERNFVNTHQTVLNGKHIAYLISGPLSQNHNAREILQAYVEAMKGSLVGIVTDESSDNSILSGEIDALAADLTLHFEKDIVNIPTCLGVGGLKIFRDDIYGGLRFVFQGDHRYYRHNGIYNFPQKKIFKRLGVSFMVLMTRIPYLRKKIREQLKEGMLRPYRAVVR